MLAAPVVTTLSFELFRTTVVVCSTFHYFEGCPLAEQ